MAIYSVSNACATSRSAGWYNFSDSIDNEFDPIYSFDTNKSLSGERVNNQWVSIFTPILPDWPIRLNADLGEERDVRVIRYVNYHERGFDTIYGFNHVRVYGAKDTEEGLAAYKEVRSKFYNGLTLLTNGTVELVKHVDTLDNFYADSMNNYEYIVLPNHGFYRYFIFEIDDAFLAKASMTGIRRIEFTQESSSSSSTEMHTSSSSSESSSSSTEIQSSSSTFEMTSSSSDSSH